MTRPATSCLPARGPHRRSMATTSTPAGRWETCTPSTRRRSKPVWHKNIWKDFGGGELPRWAIVQHPLIYGNLLIVAPQTSQAGVVAYDKLTGELKWKSAAAVRACPATSARPSSRSADEDHLVMTMASVGRGRNAKDGSVNGLDPLSGKVLWTYTDWQCPIPVPQPVDAGDGRVLITGGLRRRQRHVQGPEERTTAVTESRSCSRTPISAPTRSRRFSTRTTSIPTTRSTSAATGSSAMSMDGQIKWKTDQQPAFVRGGSILADGLLLTTDGNTKLYLVEPDPPGSSRSPAPWCSSRATTGRPWRWSMASC